MAHLHKMIACDNKSPIHTKKDDFAGRKMKNVSVNIVLYCVNFLWFLMNLLKFTLWVALLAPFCSTSIDCKINGVLQKIVGLQQLLPIRCSRSSDILTPGTVACENTIAQQEDLAISTI